MKFVCVTVLLLAVAVNALVVKEYFSESGCPYKSALGGYYVENGTCATGCDTSWDCVPALKGLAYLLDERNFTRDYMTPIPLQNCSKLYSLMQGEGDSSGFNETIWSCGYCPNNCSGSSAPTPATKGYECHEAAGFCGVKSYRYSLDFSNLAGQGQWGCTTTSTGGMSCKGAINVYCCNLPEYVPILRSDAPGKVANISSHFRAVVEGFKGAQRVHIGCFGSLSYKIVDGQYVAEMSCEQNIVYPAKSFDTSMQSRLLETESVRGVAEIGWKCFVKYDTYNVSVGFGTGETDAPFYKTLTMFDPKFAEKEGVTGIVSNRVQLELVDLDMNLEDDPNSTGCMLQFSFLALAIALLLCLL